MPIMLKANITPPIRTFLYFFIEIIPCKNTNIYPEKNNLDEPTGIMYELIFLHYKPVSDD